MVAAVLARGLFLGGGMIGNVLGGALSGAGAAVGGLAQGVGSAVGGIGQGVGSAVGGAITPAPKITVNNFGIAGSAAKGKVTGGGTLPALKKVAKPIVNANMPTEKLLVVAVNYLSSIDNTLQAQIKFERDLFVQQAQAERESAIESGGQKDSIFTRLSNKFSGMSDDSTIKSRAGTITKAILAAAGIAGLGLLALGNLDTKELDRLKDSYKAFNEKFDFLGPLAKGVASTGSIVGFLLKGFRGGIIGLVAEYLIKRFTGKSIFENITGTGEEADGTQAPQNPGSYDYAMAGGLAGYGAYRGVKTFGQIKNARANIAKTQAAPRIMSSGGRLGFRDPVTGKIAAKAASSAGGGWLSGPKGRRWVAFLLKRFGKTFLARKIMPLLARALAGIAIASTGIGVIPGALLTFITVASSAFLIYDIISAYWDWTEEEDALKDAEATSGLKPQPDATSTSGSAAIPALAANRIMAYSETGLPEEAQAFFESKGWTKEQAAGIVGNLIVESGLKTDAVGDGGKAYGIAQWHPDRQEKFRNYSGKDIRQSNFQEQLEFVNWELNNTEKRAGAALRGASSTADAAAIVDAQYERSAGTALAQRQANAIAISEGDYANLQGGGGGTQRSTSVMGSLADLGKGAIESIGNVFQSGLGAMSTTKGSQLSNKFNDNMQTHVKSESAAATQISKMSTVLQNVVDLGQPDPAKAAAQPESAGISPVGKTGSSNDSKRDHFDPNYPSDSLLMEKYMQHQKLVIA
jgi:hypothetical protein